MSVKRYANFLGAMVEAPGSSYNGYMKYVLDEDYAALEAAINEEPELPGEMPEAMWQTISYAVEQDDMETLTELLRIIVRQTKAGIKKRALESALKS